MLGGDEDDAVGTLRTVDGSGRSVLEDFHRYDVSGVDGSQRRDCGHAAVAEASETEIAGGIAAALDDYAVNDVEGLRGGVDRSLAAHADGGRGARGSGSLHGGDTGGTTLEGLVKVRDDRTLEVFLPHRHGRTG